MAVSYKKLWKLLIDKKRKELSKMLMISEDGVKYHLKKLKNKGLIEHIGTSRGGYWRVK